MYSAESSSEGTLLFNEVELNVIEPRSLIEKVATDLSNLYIYILLFGGRFNQIDEEYRKITTVKTEQGKCLICQETWLILYRETLLKSINREVRIYLQEYCGVSLPLALSK